MLTLLTERVLDELTLIKSVLSGECPLSEMPEPMAEVACEEEHRSQVALTLVRRLGNMVNRVRDVSNELEGVVVALAGPTRKTAFMPLPGMKGKEDRSPFGFASARKAA